MSSAKCRPLDVRPHARAGVEIRLAAACRVGRVGFALMRGRELKSNSSPSTSPPCWFALMRGRELKFPRQKWPSPPLVRPHARAGVEIVLLRGLLRSSGVRPHARAGVEICGAGRLASPFVFALMRGRELKYRHWLQRSGRLPVRPHARAGVEMSSLCRWFRTCSVRPHARAGVEI